MSRRSATPYNSLSPASTSLGNRRAEINAAFDDANSTSNRATSAMPTDGPPGYDTATSSSASQGASHTSDVFFDAGDAMGEEPPRPSRRHESLHDPLGASGVEDEEAGDGEESLDAAAALLSQGRPHSATRSMSNNANLGGYDFERPSHFGANRSRSSSTGANGSGHPVPGLYGANTEASGSRIALDSSGPITSTLPPTDVQGMARARRLLGRFGRFVGMRVPGAAYSSLAQEEANGGATRRRRVMGGGLGQDGVFANLNAKPETRRRRGNNGGPEDRGEDDDLAEDILPPTYEVAAADAAPGYWETTIAPGGLGWTPGGGHVGDVEDLILEGLPIGNVFGFAWNLLVSMCFQFVGFLLTYLLHTTHAARCGSRAGLGITLIQYGFYLRTRALQLGEDGSDNGSGGRPGSNGNGTGEPQAVDWFGNPLNYDGQSSPQAAVRDVPSATTSVNGSLATALASDASNLPPHSPSGDLNTDTSEWLAYALMIVGWLILLSSLISYWRIHRWGRNLVAASRREQESARAAENGGEAGEVTEVANVPVGFMHRLQAILAATQARSDGRSTGTGEDWVVYPGSAAGPGSGRGVAGASSTVPPSADRAAPSIWGAPPRTGLLAFPVAGMDEQEESLDESGEHLSPEEQRLMEDLRRPGLL